MTAPALDAVTTLTAQRIVIRALADLLTRDLPPATWTINGIGVAGTTNGQLDWRPPLADRRAAITRWAEALGATPELRRYHTSEPDQGGAWHLEAEHLFAKVDVWVSLTMKDIAELDAEQSPAVTS